MALTPENRDDIVKKYQLHENDRGSRGYTNQNFPCHEPSPFASQPARNLR